jgi:hypothetical protein
LVGAQHANVLHVCVERVRDGFAVSDSVADSSSVQTAARPPQRVRDAIRSGHPTEATMDEPMNARPQWTCVPK